MTCPDEDVIYSKLLLISILVSCCPVVSMINLAIHKAVLTSNKGGKHGRDDIV